MKLTMKPKVPANTPAPESPLRGMVRKRMEQVRMSRWAKPCGPDKIDLDPKLPHDLTAINEHQLGMLWTQFCAMVQWSKMVATDFAVDAAEAKMVDRRLRAKAFLQTKGDGSREERAAMVETEDLVVQSVNHLFYCEALRDLSLAVYEGYLTGKEAISREITRRQSLEEHRGQSGESPRRRVPFGKRY